MTQTPGHLTADDRPSACKTAARLPVAIIGDGYQARYYAECLQHDARFHIVSRSESLPAEDDLRQAIAVFVLNEPAERAATIRNCLTRGQHVLTQSPVCWPPACWPARSLGADIESLAASTQSPPSARTGNHTGTDAATPADALPPRVLILRRGIEDPDFLRACQVIADGEAGPVLHLDFLRRQMGAFLLPDDPDTQPAADVHPAADTQPAAGTSCRPDTPRLSETSSLAETSAPPDRTTAFELTYGVLAAFGADLLAQTLTLIPQPVIRLFATLARRRPHFGPVTASPGLSRLASRPDKIDSGFRVWLEFETGQTAQIGIDLASHADIETGWTLQTTRGGYRQGRQVLTEPDGEIYDVPVEVEAAGLLDGIADVLQGRQAGGDRSPGTRHLHETLISFQTELRVLRLLSAILESDAAQQCLTCRL